MDPFKVFQLLLQSIVAFVHGLVKFYEGLGGGWLVVNVICPWTWENQLIETRREEGMSTWDIGVFFLCEAGGLFEEGTALVSF